MLQTHSEESSYQHDIPAFFTFSGRGVNGRLIIRCTASTGCYITAKCFLLHERISGAHQFLPRNRQNLTAAAAHNGKRPSLMLCKKAKSILITTDYAKYQLGIASRDSHNEGAPRSKLLHHGLSLAAWQCCRKRDECCAFLNLLPRHLLCRARRISEGQ